VRVCVSVCVCVFVLDVYVCVCVTTTQQHTTTHTHLVSGHALALPAHNQDRGGVTRSTFTQGDCAKTRLFDLPRRCAGSSDTPEKSGVKGERGVGFLSGDGGACEQRVVRAQL
jgi:hypothetical protein